MRNWKLFFLLGLTLAVAAAGARAEDAAKAEENPRPVVVITTNFGEIHVQLDRVHSPLSVKNFLEYVADGHYDGTIFHRVIPGFMIQGGGRSENLREKPTRGPIQNEAHNGLKNRRGTIAMARTTEIHSASAQFFINLKDNNDLNYKNSREYGYAVFGRVIRGMEVVDRIAKVKTETRGRHEDVPREPVIIESVRLL